MFIKFCVGLVMVVVSAFVTLLIGLVWTKANEYFGEDDDDFMGNCWLVSVIALGIALTVIMFQNGILV